MRPMGGLQGGATALELGTEHQGLGTPHGHGQLHVVCKYPQISLFDKPTDASLIVVVVPRTKVRD